MENIITQKAKEESLHLHSYMLLKFLIISKHC